jgi:hypothetical protein
MSYTSNISLFTNKSLCWQLLESHPEASANSFWQKTTHTQPQKQAWVPQNKKKKKERKKERNRKSEDKYIIF